MTTKYRHFLTKENIAILIVSIILLQTLPFKFFGFQESIDLFTKLWQEPRGRIWTGILELLGVIGLWTTSIKKYAAMWIALLMMGALYFHVTVLGLDSLAVMALIVLICSIFIVMKK